MTTRRRAREVALQVLYEEDVNPLRELAVADQFVAKRMLNNKPLIAFAQQILSGVREHRDELDDILTKHAANWSIKRMTTIDRNILRMSSYEMLYSRNSIRRWKEVIYIAIHLSQYQAKKLDENIMKYSEFIGLLESLLSDFVGGDVDGALKDWFKSGVRTVNKIDPVQLLNVNEGELDEKLTKKTKVDTYIKDFKDSDAPQFKGKSEDKKVKMAVAAYLSKKNK
jgi:N utilization substance protein B